MGSKLGVPLTISLEKQYTQLNLAHNMNNTSEMVALSVIALNWVAPVNKWCHGWVDPP